MKHQRIKFIDSIKKQLIGTDLKNDVLIGQKPLDRFFTGFLFPIIENEDGLDKQDDNDFISENLEDKEEIKSVKKEKRYMPPSSAGFSFFITGESIKLRVYYNAVFYDNNSERDENRQKFIQQQWMKIPLADDGKEIEFTLDGLKQFKIFDEKARIDALWRPYSNGYIVTITMSNNQKIEKTENAKQFNLEQNQKSLFEVEFKCIIDSGNIDVYPSKNKELLSDEEKEIELRYKDLHIYAVGHGTAVNWKINKHDKMEIWTDFIPTVEVPQVTADTGGKNDKALEFAFLQNCNTDGNVIDVLETFVKNYELWIETQKQKIDTEDEEDKVTAHGIVKNLNSAKDRMLKGINLLKNDGLARMSFGIANKAMLYQMEAFSNRICIDDS